LLWFPGRWLATQFGLSIMTKTTPLSSRMTLGNRLVSGLRLIDRPLTVMQWVMQVVMQWSW
jgi:hypothetical protein